MGLKRLVLTGLTALVAAFSTTCAVPPDNPKPIPEPRKEEKLTDIIECGLEHIRIRDYATARAYFSTYAKSIPTENSQYSTNAHMDFLHALSHIPDGSVWDGKYNTAGKTLTALFYRIQKTPALLESLQEFMKPVFELDDYKTSKKHLGRLGGRYQMFSVLLNLVEENYEAAEEALKIAYPCLTENSETQEKTAVRDTLKNLHAMAEHQFRTAVLQELKLMITPDSSGALTMNQTLQKRYEQRKAAYESMLRVAQ